MEEFKRRTLSENALEIIECLNENGWKGHIVDISNDEFCFRYEKGNICVQIDRMVVFEQNDKLFGKEGFTAWSSDNDIQTFSCNQLDSVILGIKEESGDRTRYYEFRDEETGMTVRLHYENDNPKIECLQ